MTTPFGPPSAPVVQAKVEEKSFFFIPRHGVEHTLLPHEINYRANVYALKSLGVHYLVSISAVGSLREDLPPTKFVLVDQFIDWTKGLRDRTFFGQGMVAHVSAANPVNKELQEMVAGVCREQDMDHFVGGTYICIEGPQFSSWAESEIYRSFGAAVIGMTNVPEAYLAKEAGMAYATIAMVTDYDCWREQHCTVEEILKFMVQNNQKAQHLIKALISKFHQHKFDFPKENAQGLLTRSINCRQKIGQFCKCCYLR